MAIAGRGRSPAVPRLSRSTSEPGAASTGPWRPSKGRATPPQPPKAVVLAPEASADVRNQLIGELTNLTRAPDLTAWAKKALPRKNQLSIPDAMKVEAAFVEQLDRLCQEAPAESKDQSTKANGLKSVAATEAASQPVIMLSKPVRERDRSHLKYVASQPCLVCGRTPSDPHHLKFTESWTAGARSATASPYRSAGCITMNCTGVAMKETGGSKRPSTRWQSPALSGTRPMPRPKATWSTSTDNP